MTSRYLKHINLGKLNNIEPQNECISLTSLDQIVDWPDELTALLDFSLRMDPLPSVPPSVHLYLLTVFQSPRATYLFLGLCILGHGTNIQRMMVPGLSFSVLFTGLVSVVIQVPGNWPCPLHLHNLASRTLCAHLGINCFSPSPKFCRLRLCLVHSSVPQSSTIFSSG